MDKLEYIEQSARETVRFHLDCMDHLNRESHVTLTFALGGMGASFAAGLKLLEGGPATGLAVSLLIIALYFALIGVVITRSCLKVRDAMPPGNEPDNLLPAIEGHTLDEIRQAELNNLQLGLDTNRKRNDRLAESLNFSRLALCASPAIFLVVWAAAAWVLAALE